MLEVAENASLGYEDDFMRPPSVSQQKVKFFAEAFLIMLKCVNDRLDRDFMIKQGRLNGNLSRKRLTAE